MSAQPVHLAIDVRSVLARPLHELRGFTHPDGRAMTPRQAKAALVAQLAEGNELLSIGRSAPFDFIRR
ncbi:hypothetical protein BA896_012605 [Janthinobacterium lividum]|uniref:Uncharacterized protein n=1 Tax=Janthinobacterium lividum TaxID=29581 RepID=A0A1E8PUL7_9BURK|nr:hypothetical protein BA896_012605 [Janthinobacterium lividum]